MTEMKHIITTRPCPRCRREQTLEVTAEEFDAWQSGAKVQDAFPTRSADFRGAILTGYHGRCWDLDMPPENDDDVLATDGESYDWEQQAWEDDTDKDTREAVWNGLDDAV